MTGRTGAFGVGAGLVAIVLVASAVIGLARVDEQRRRNEADAVASSIAGSVAVDVAAGVAAAARRLEVLASSASDHPPSVLVARAVDGFSSVSFVDGDGTSLVEGVSAPSVVESPAFAAAARKARDTGSWQMSAPVGTEKRSVLVVPLYSGSAGLSEVPPAASTESRRSSIAALVVGVVDVEQFVRESNVARGSVAVVDADTELAAVGSAGAGRERTVGVEVGDRRWTVTSVVAPAATPGALSVVLAVGIVGAAITATVIVARQKRRGVVVESQLATEKQRRGVIAELAPLLQRSVHLSDVLPAFAVQLTDRFGLEGLSVVAPGDDRVSHELFCHGLRPPMSNNVEVGLVRPLTAGSTALLTLTRGGRIVAELRFVAGRDLDERDVEGVHTSAELVTSAIVTARAIERQQAAMNQLSELDSLKNVFLTTAAHELKTPLAAMMGMADVLDSHWDVLGEDERRTMVQRVAENAHALDHLMSDLLDFSRLETGELTVDLRPMDLADVVLDLFDRVSAAWSGHTFDVNVEAGPAILGDLLAIERILTNLVSNAVKYSETGTTVRVTVRHDVGHAELIVDDEGTGIDVADRERVFERFYRGSGDTVVRTRGVGVGLSVVREFVRKLGGTVLVGDSPSRGARLRCRFPHHEMAPTGVDATTAARSDGEDRT